MRSNTQHLSGLTGLTTAACLNRLVIYHLQSTRRCIIKTKIRLWLPDSNETVSGEPGGIHLCCRSVVRGTLECLPLATFGIIAIYGYLLCIPDRVHQLVFRHNAGARLVPAGLIGA